VGDTPEYVNKTQLEVFEVLAEAKSLEDLKRIRKQFYGNWRIDLQSRLGPMLWDAAASPGRFGHCD
jgi:hypothetical protein